MSIKDHEVFKRKEARKVYLDLLNSSSIKNQEGKEVLFKVCYAFCAFDENKKRSDVAVDFIKKNILNDMSEENLIANFKGIDVNKNADVEYAYFFMNNYKNDNKIIEVLVNGFNNYDKIKEAYPSKVIKTNRNDEKLTLEDVLSVSKSIMFENVKSINLANPAIDKDAFKDVELSKDKPKEISKGVTIEKYINFGNLTLDEMKSTNEIDTFHFIVKNNKEPIAMLHVVHNPLTNKATIGDVTQKGDSFRVDEKAENFKKIAEFIKEDLEKIGRKVDKVDSKIPTPGGRK